MALRINPYRTQIGIWIPIALLESNLLGPISKLIYGRLCLFAGEKGYCWPSIQALSAAVRVSKSSCKTALKELVREGLIEVEHRKTEDQAENETNFYFFLDHPILHVEELKGVRGTVDRGGAESALPPLGQNLPQGGAKSDPKKIHRKDSSEKQQQSTPPAAASPAADPQNLPGEVEEFLAGLPPGCRIVMQKFPTLPQTALLAALQKIKRRLANIPDPPAYLFTLLSSPDAAAATPLSPSSSGETAKDRARRFYLALPPEKQEELVLLGQGTQGGSRDPIYTGWCAILADPEIAAQFAA